MVGELCDVRGVQIAVRGELLAVRVDGLREVVPVQQFFCGSDSLLCLVPAREKLARFLLHVPVRLGHVDESRFELVVVLQLRQHLLV